MFRRAKTLVGLDIGSSAVKAVELKASGKTYKVTAFGAESVPPDSIVDGAIIDGAAVADAIRRLFESRERRVFGDRDRARLDGFRKPDELLGQMRVRVVHHLTIDERAPVETLLRMTEEPDANRCARQEGEGGGRDRKAEAARKLRIDRRLDGDEGARHDAEQRPDQSYHRYAALPVQN